MKRLIYFILQGMIFFCLHGCISETTPEKMIKCVNNHAMETVNSLYYIGSLDGYDFFVHKTLLFTHKRKIVENEFPLDKKIPFSNNQSKWIELKSGRCGGGNSEL